MRDCNTCLYSINNTGKLCLESGCFKENDYPLYQSVKIKKLNWKKAKAEIEEYHDKYCNSEAAHRTFNKIQEIINNNITEE